MTEITPILLQPSRLLRLANPVGATLAICGGPLADEVSLGQLGLEPFNPEDLPWWQPEEYNTSGNRLS